MGPKADARPVGEDRDQLDEGIAGDGIAHTIGVDGGEAVDVRHNGAVATSSQRERVDPFVASVVVHSLH